MRTLLVVLLAAAACGGTPTRGGDPPAAVLELAAAGFVFHYTASDAALVPALGPHVEQPAQRIAADLAAGAMPPVHVYVYETNAQMADAVRALVPSIPSSATGLVTAADRIHLVSPSRLGQDVERAAVTVLHEFAHCVSLRLNAASGNNPRWLWESVALYAARQRVDPRTLSYAAAGDLPSLAALSSMSNPQIYDVGYLIAEFIVERAGMEGLRALILANGDTRRVLGIDESTFEAQWRDFVRARYLTSTSP